MDRPPFDVRFELEGWALFWALLEARPGAGEELAALRRRVAREARDRLSVGTLAGDPTVAALRRLFRAAGTDPTRYRPSSEALLRRLLKGEELPAIHPLVDLNNCLSAHLAVPCCVMAEGTFEGDLELRAGVPGESYESLRGPFKLEGRPLLVDARGPCDTPITGNERVEVTGETKRAWLAAYLPAGVVEPAAAHRVLAEMLEQAPAARLLQAAASEA